MPGAPNKPPDSAAAVPAPPTDSTAKLLRRLVPSRIALRLDSWRQPLSPELLGPYLEAEACLGRGDIELASGCLDQLAIRFAEPRWPTLPAPFQVLQVQVVRPQPPHWDPDHGVTPEEKATRKARRALEGHAGLVKAALELETRKGTPTADLAELAAAVEAALAAGETEAFWSAADRIWAALRDRVPVPAAPARAASAPREPEAGDAPA
ncbi:MAG: hypothetical protein L3K04_00790 [Thermoplasmata archaeon]|nr:hypothetical protein [Thermoplasmata archaeon]MCI4340847.1 hypothetical protein [Thermoplasmata archaeon]